MRADDWWRGARIGRGHPRDRIPAVRTLAEDEVATVVVNTRVAEGRDAEYLAWQARMDDAARAFPGFVDAQTVRPLEGTDDDWSLIYRFESAGQLRDWLGSDRREELLREGADLVEDARQNAMSGGDAPPGVTLVLRHDVRPGAEAAFERAWRALQREESHQPGFLGADLLPPVPGVQGEWTSLTRFDTRAHLDAWVGSEARAALLEPVRATVDGHEVTRVSSPFGAWFALDVVDGRTTPSWKQAMAIFLVLYPAVMLESLFLAPELAAAGLPMWLLVFVVNLITVAALTWVLMPVATRALRRWLTPRASRSATATGFVVVIALSALTVLGFALTA
jgi:antibiotic biosynthesis monooxygenase (ABM) superfamily enzyme